MLTVVVNDLEHLLSNIVEALTSMAISSRNITKALATKMKLWFGIVFVVEVMSGIASLGYVQTL